MTLTCIPAEDRSLSIGHEPAGPIEPATPPRVGLSTYDEAAVTAFVGGDSVAVADLVEDVRKLADALAGDDGDAARVRLLARAAAAARAQQRALEALLGRCLAQRDYEGVEAVSRVLDGVSRRLALSLKHLAVESQLRRRPAVFIRHANSVNFGEER